LLKADIPVKYRDHYMMRLFQSDQKYQKRPSSATLNEVYKNVTAPDNTYRLGLSHYDGLAKKSRLQNHIQQAEHLRLKEDVKYLLSSRLLKEAEPLLPKLAAQPEDLEG
jgi:hypothetical protein